MDDLSRMKREVVRKIIPVISMPDYFNEVAVADVEASPVEVLNTAAAQMNGRTGGLVQAKVYLVPFLGTMRYTFYLVIPTLNDYTDPLFYVWTPQPDRGYPVYLLESGATQQEEQPPYETAEDLAKRLEEVFSSSWAKSRIRQWIEMAEERGAAR